MAYGQESVYTCFWKRTGAGYLQSVTVGGDHGKFLQGRTQSADLYDHRRAGYRKNGFHDRYFQKNAPEERLDRCRLPVFLLMTGLYENINALQNEKSLTFLYRAPKMELAPLNIGAVARNYKKTFQLDDSSALEMAKLTRGYSFAFQVLGYFTWENHGKTEGVLDDYRQYLEDYVYEKIWAELSRGDRRVLFGIARSAAGRISEIRDILQMETNQFNPYRKRLIRRGIINGEVRGYVHFVLPLFEQFVLENYSEE